MAILLTYDINHSHSLVKQTLLDAGYREALAAQNPQTGASGAIYLPNTTVYHVFRSKEVAYADLQAAAARHGVLIERCLIVTMASNTDYYGTLTTV